MGSQPPQLRDRLVIKAVGAVGVHAHGDKQVGRLLSQCQGPTVLCQVNAGYDNTANTGFTCSPHVGGVSEDAYVNMGVGAARNVIEEMARAPA